jgi:hypothetical protein
MSILIKICSILLYYTQNESQFKRNLYILTTFIEIVYIVMSIVGIVKGVQNYGSNKKE